MELDLQVSPEDIMSREVELGCESWTSLRVVRQQQCNRHCLCDCPNTAVETAFAPCTSRTLFWRRSTVSPVFFGRYPRSSLHSLALFPPVPVPNKPPRFCGRKAIWSRSAHFVPSSIQILYSPGFSTRKMSRKCV